VGHWTKVLGDVAVAEFVLLAVVSLAGAVRRRPQGTWASAALALVAAVFVTVRADPGLATEQGAAASLLAALLAATYCLFRFAASFRRPQVAVRLAAAVLPAGALAVALALGRLPVGGTPAPPGFAAAQGAAVVATTFLLGFACGRFLLASRGEALVAAWRMRVLALGLAGLGAAAVLVALDLASAPGELAMAAVVVAAGLALLVALASPSFVRAVLEDRADKPFHEAVAGLVSAGDSQDVADRLLPRVCALVGASEVALLAVDGTVVARRPLWREGAHLDPWGPGAPAASPAAGSGRTTVLARGGSHVLAVRVSPYLPFFATRELRRLDQLADMAGLAIERCEATEQMAFHASHDVLTGLANRALFMERLEEALGHVGRRRSALAVLFIDLDRFKLVNDRADHGAGDQLLNEVAARLRSMTRGVDVVARFGGDEFVAFAEVEHDEDARDMAERIRKGLREPMTIDGASLVVTASIGVVVTADAGTTASGLLRDADNAMYEAKRAGRDQVVVHARRARPAGHDRWERARAGRARVSAG
jgi:diguanylate cyclase (GGDEF)-like protein